MRYTWVSSHEHRSKGTQKQWLSITLCDLVMVCGTIWTKFLDETVFGERA